MLAELTGEQGDYEKLNFLFWKSRDKKFVLQDRETKDKVDLDVGVLIYFDASTVETGWVKWANKVPDYKSDTIAGIDNPVPEGEDWKRYFNVTVEVNGERRTFSGEGPTAEGMAGNLFGAVLNKLGITEQQIKEQGLQLLKPFTAVYDGVRTFDSQAGELGVPVFKDVKLADAPAASEQAPPKDEMSDDIPF